MMLRKRRWTVFGVSVLSLMQGCASNNALFAEYDEYCYPSQLAMQTVNGTAVVVAERVGSDDAGIPWEPAVYFGFDQASLEQAELGRLDTDIDALRTHTDLKIGVQGFTDVKGPSEYNRKLAARRVDAVVRYLTEHGIDAQRILQSPIGEGLAGDSVDVRKLNRRVELMLLDSDGQPLTFELRLVDSAGDATPFPVPVL